MSRLIDADKLKDAVYESFAPYQMEWARTIHQTNKTIDAQPTVEAVPVIHGEWLNFYGDFSTAECNKCSSLYEVSPNDEPEEEFFNAFKQFYNFCPNCGADMRKKV